MACIPHITLLSLLPNWVSSLFYPQNNSSSAQGTQEEQGRDREGFHNTLPYNQYDRAIYRPTQAMAPQNVSGSTDIKIRSRETISLSESSQGERRNQVKVREETRAFIHCALMQVTCALKRLNNLLPSNTHKIQMTHLRDGPPTQRNLVGALIVLFTFQLLLPAYQLFLES